MPAIAMETDVTESSKPCSASFIKNINVNLQCLTFSFLAKQTRTKKDENLLKKM